jgi:single-stranded DNA-binding protein
MAMTFQLDGRMTRSAEIVTYADGDEIKEMARITLAADRGAKSDKTDFFTVAVFGADNVDQLTQLTNGDRVVLDGIARQDVWTDKHDQTRYDVTFTSNQVVSAIARKRPASAATLAHVAQPERSTPAAAR